MAERDGGGETGLAQALLRDDPEFLQ